MSEQQPEVKFVIQSVYLKDLSYETPNTPHIFREQWKPEMKVNLDSKADALEEGVYNVVLQVTVTVKSGETTAFLAEVHQAGVFTISGMEGEQLEHTLAAYCPNILFPYAREVVTSLVARGGFPQLVLAPVNFDALYAHRKQQQAKAN